MIKVKVKIIVVLSVGSLLFAVNPVCAWINLYNDSSSQHPAYEQEWQIHKEDHTLTMWNNGSTNENFFDTRFVLNLVKYEKKHLEEIILTWNTEHNYFWDGKKKKVEITDYDGIFDNTSGQIPNMQIGQWPYFSYGDLLATGNQVSNTFEVKGKYSHLEGDTIAEVKPVPEPQSIILFSIGISGLFLFGIKRKVKPIH